MALIKIPSEDVTLRERAEVTAFLATHGIEYERWTPEHPVGPDASSDALLAAYAREIDTLKRRGGYVTADVIDVKPDTPNLDMMLAKFSREHWHDEDEVRFIIEGRGLFHIHPATGPVFAIEVEAGDLDPRAARHAPLVRPLRRPPHPRHPAVPGRVGLDAALHRQRRRQGLRAGLLRADLRTARMILLDIEGTTTPIAFVTQTLFPYARVHLRSYLDRHGTRRSTSTLMAGFRRSTRRTSRPASRVLPWSAPGGPDARPSVQAYAEWLMDRDRKSPALKELQGYIWEEGYQKGELVGQVYEDVPRAFARWRREQVRLGIFSSGAVLAQRWLFRCSSAGDLLAFLHWYFDTHTGAKQDPESYRRIAEEVGELPPDILFVSDVVGELNAARAAG